MSAQAKPLSMQEVKEHKAPNSTWIVIDNNVYDVTEFMNEHPGGADSIMEYAGNDASQAFEDVGHSSDARELLKKLKIGQLNPNKAPLGKGKSNYSRERPARPPGPRYWPWALVALAGALVVGFAVKKYYS